MADADQSHLTTLTVDLLSAYLANNTVDHGALPELIKSTHGALKVIDSPEPPAPAEPEYKPAVSVRKSLGSRSHIVSMIDGKPYQTLKRHLSKHGLTPKEYRERYSLPVDYPMVAPAYSESRRAIAERLGLGRKVAGAQATKAKDVKAPAAEAPPAPSRTKQPAAAKTSTAPAKAAAKPKASVKPASVEPKPATETKAPVTAKAKPGLKPRAKASGVKAAASSTATAAAKPAPRKRTAKATEPAN